MFLSFLYLLVLQGALKSLNETVLAAAATGTAPEDDVLESTTAIQVVQSSPVEDVRPSVETEVQEIPPGAKNPASREFGTTAETDPAAEETSSATIATGSVQASSGRGAGVISPKAHAEETGVPEGRAAFPAAEPLISFDSEDGPLWDGPSPEAAPGQTTALPVEPEDLLEPAGAQQTEVESSKEDEGPAEDHEEVNVGFLFYGTNIGVTTE